MTAPKREILYSSVAWVSHRATMFSSHHAYLQILLQLDSVTFRRGVLQVGYSLSYTCTVKFYWDTAVLQCIRTKDTTCEGWGPMNHHQCNYNGFWRTTTLPVPHSTVQAQRNPSTANSQGKGWLYLIQEVFSIWERSHYCRAGSRKFGLVGLKVIRR